MDTIGNFSGNVLRRSDTVLKIGAREGSLRPSFTRATSRHDTGENYNYIVKCEELVNSAYPATVLKFFCTQIKGPESCKKSTPEVH